MVKSYKGVKYGRGCEGITVSRRCAAEGASIFDQTSPRVVVDGSYGFLRFLSGAKYAPNGYAVRVRRDVPRKI